MATFIAHLNVTIKHLRYKQKGLLPAMLEGKSMPSSMAPLISKKRLDRASIV